MLEHPSIPRYSSTSVGVKMRRVRTISREVLWRSRVMTPQRPHASHLFEVKIWSGPHGDVGRWVRAHPPVRSRQVIK
jgi:hypothetical protein